MSTTDGVRAKVKAGATRAKLALIAVLAIVLMGVMAAKFRTSGEPAGEMLAAKAPEAAEEKAPANTTPKLAAAATGSGSAKSDSPFGDFAADDSWLAPSMREVTKFDPFAPPEWAAVPKAEETADEEVSAKQLNELLSSKDAIIFLAGDKRVARIGKMEFRVGDVIGHYKISDITSQGVVLSEAP